MDAEFQVIVDDLKAKMIAHGKQMLLEVVVDALPAVLEAAAKKSATPVDDMLVAALKEPLKAELKALIEKL